jgi:glycerol-3-phosphate acyltransferase PlsY
VDEPFLHAALIVMGYLVGSLPMGVIMARLTGGTDPRTVGSGRTGGTNVLRAMGWPRAIAVAALDLAKGAFPILVARWLEAPVEIQALAGLATVVGSWKSVFLRFHGGRGVATGVGGMLVVSPLICLLAAPVFFIVVGITRYVSLGSILVAATGAGLAVIFVALDELDAGWLIYILPGAALIWIAHRDNIQRLLNGTERKFDPRDRRATPAPGSTATPAPGETPPEDSPPPADG